MDKDRADPDSQSGAHCCRRPRAECTSPGRTITHRPAGLGAVACTEGPRPRPLPSYRGERGRGCRQTPRTWEVARTAGLPAEEPSVPSVIDLQGRWPGLWPPPDFPLPSPHVVFGIHICTNELQGALGGARPQQPAGGPRTLAAGPREPTQAKAGRDVRHTPYRWGKGPESHLDHPVCSQVRERPGVARRPLGFRQVSQKMPPPRHAGAAVCSGSATSRLGEFK